MDVEAPIESVLLVVVSEVSMTDKTQQLLREIRGLIKEMGRKSLDISQAPSLLLRRVSPTVPELVEALGDRGSDTCQVVVARTLGRIGPTAAPAVPALSHALTSEFTHVRQAAADALCEIGQAAEPAVPALACALADWSPMVRQAAARALALVGRGAELAIPALIQLLPDREDQVREAAIEALAAVGQPTVPPLTKFLESPDLSWLENWFKEAVEWCNRTAERLEKGEQIAIAYRPGQDDIDAIRREPLKALRNAGWSFRHAVEDQLRLETAREGVARIFGKIGPAAADAVPALMNALADKNWRMRLAAARSLGQIGAKAEAALPVLVKALVDQGEPVRKAAAEALKRIDANWASNSLAQSSIEALVERLKRTGEEGKVTLDAFAVIGPASVPVLVAALVADDRVLREAAATALGRMGPGAQAAIPALVKAAQDSHGWVREAAAQALQKIDPQGSRVPGEESGQ
jgi:HEAT repeat protein